MDSQFSAERFGNSQRASLATTRRLIPQIVGAVLGLWLALTFSTVCLGADNKKILLLAGRPSHGSGDHEFRAGSLLLQKCLAQFPGISIQVISNGWPTDDKVFEGVSALMMYADGGSGHPAIKPERMKLLDQLAEKGVGIGAAHYGVEVPAGDSGFAMLRWTGGYFEPFWSVNPTWVAEFKTFPSHPITRGVQPFKINDEWYFYMRFAPDMAGVTPILSTVAPASTMDRGNGPHSGNPFVRASVSKGEKQHLMWAFERPNGGRGFGFTGGHYHKNWGDPNFRKLVLNAILWSAKIEVPNQGLESQISSEDLAANLDPKGK